MEPSNEIFDSTHELLDDKGNTIYPQGHRRDVSDATNFTDVTSSGLVRQQSTFKQHIHSVFLAEGLHLSIDSDEMDELPRRFDAGSSKARLTWFGALCLAGIGMFVEAYIIITTGQIKTLWHAGFPTCFTPDEDMACPTNIQCCGLFPNTPETCGSDTNVCNADGTYPDKYLCNESIIAGISYSEFAGIMLGMLVFGRIADLMGGSVAGMLTATFQLIGVCFMTFFQGSTLNTQYLVFAIFFGVFGFGVGGEYPLTAASAASHHVESMAEAALDNEERHRIRVLREKERSIRRGETISLVFAMQGMGAVIGSLFVLVLIYFGRQTDVDCNGEGNNPKGQSVEAISAIWRTFYFIGLIFVFMVLVYRGLIHEEGGGHEKLMARKERRASKLGHQGGNTFTLLKYYAPRLIGTGGNWFLVDIVFYGLKLFSGPIMLQIDPSGNLLTTNGYLLLNNICGLAGYYAAAYVIDKPKIGRRNLQLASYATCVVLFAITGAVFNTASPSWLLFLYFMSSFVTNWANVTTYVMAAETYPTELRATCHGISAFMGKTGALLATLVFSHLTSPQIFFVCSGVGVIGSIFTLFFSVDLTHVSLAEHDAQLELFLEGRVEDYKGKLNAKKHLSLYEKLTGRHGEYQPDWAISLVRKDMERALLGDIARE